MTFVAIGALKKLFIAFPHCCMVGIVNVVIIAFIEITVNLLVQCGY